MQAGPKLLVRWEPRWSGFVESIRPALARSKPRLELECRNGARFGGHSVASALLHCFVVLWIAIVGSQQMRGTAYIAVEEFRPDDYDIVYYSGNELPQMVDAGGAQDGVSGRSGGRELKSESEQVIRIARGPGLMKSIADAPNIKLPTNPNAANLLVPAAPELPIPPAPEVARLRPDALVLPADAVRPAPEVQRDIRKLPDMATAAIEPAAEIQRNRKTNISPLTSAVQPQPEIKRDSKPAMTLSLSAVQPAPDVRRTELARLKVPQNANVVPPAPNARRDAVDKPRLALPTGLAVQPPANVSREGDRTQAGILDALAKGIVPPNVTVVNVGSIGGASRGAQGGGTSGSTPGAGRDKNGTPGGAPGGSAVAASAAPGNALGLPSGSGPGSIALSPKGGAEAGYGGSGGGTGIGSGTGTGSGTSGTGPGAAKTGTGLGAGAATFGISLGPGPGGSGVGEGQPGGISGVTVIGSNNSVHIPSFGGATGDGPSNPPRMPGEKRRPPAVTIIATSRSGGALNRYGALKGSKVYTVYVETDAGLVAVQFSNRSTAGDPQQDLTPPEPDSANLPAALQKGRAIASCVLDRTGSFRNIRVMEYAGIDKEKFVAFLSAWRMRPVLAGEEPIEVDVILALNASTN